MERDPLSFVWRVAPALHIAAFALLLIALPLSWIALDLVRVTIDDGIGGAAFARAPSASLLRLQIELPERLADEPLVLFSGLALERTHFALATILLLVILALLVGLFVLLLRWLESAIEARAAGRLRGTILDAILQAQPSAREEARQAAAVAAEGLRDGASLGGLVITPILVGAAIVLAYLYALSVDWQLAVALVVALMFVAFAWPRRLRSEDEAVTASRAAAVGLKHILDDLVRRLPAMQAHGTAMFERQRFEEELRRRRQPLRRLERRRAADAAATVLALTVGPALVLGLGAWLALGKRLAAGEVVAATLAALLASAAMVALTRWRHGLHQTQPLFEEIARTLGALQTRGRPERAGALPGSGALVARKLAAYDPSNGVRLAGADLSLAFPSHVAAVGDGDSGARVFASLVGGQLEPSTGELTFGGVDLSHVDPAERARRIAFAGGETILVKGSLRQNLLYGCPQRDGPEMEHRVMEAATVAGLDRAIHARGLIGTVNPAREPSRHNRQATVGENILFGVALGDTFHERNLPSHPFMRAILEAENLTKPLTAIGLSIATSMIEIFADIPDGHPLFERFSFFSAAERGYFEDLAERSTERRRGAETSRDRERLISLALRYSESRHRLGLLDADIEARLVKARAAFANLLPTSLRPAIEFYDPNALGAAASLQDNLLFGRIAQDRAGAVTDIRRVVRRVLTERGLDADVIRIGLDSPVDARGDLDPSEMAAIDVARCLVRGPDVLVVERALDGLLPAAREALVARLRRALIGRGLLIVVPQLSPGLDTPPFDAVLRFERGILSMEDRRRATAPDLVQPAA